MTKAVYQNGSITGYVQMEQELNELYEKKAMQVTAFAGETKGSHLEWVYGGGPGVPERIRKLAAIDVIQIGEEQLTIRIEKDYEEIVKPIDLISLSFFLIGILLLTWVGGFVYKNMAQQKEEQQLIKKLEYEQELNRANKAVKNQEKLMEKYNHSKTIGVLTGAIAHEFNNLMTPIVLYINLLEENKTVCAEMPEEISELKSAAWRCENLAGQLLQYTRLGRTEKVLLEYNATFAVKESIHIVGRLLPERIKMKAVVCEASYYITGQVGALNQIILNLATNAIHAMKETGTLTIQFGISAEDASKVRLVVEDTGSGIPPEIKSRIFEPFFTTKTEKEGTGIGLTVVRRLVEEHGGSIRAKSKENEGSQFILDFPHIVE